MELEYGCRETPGAGFSLDNSFPGYEHGSILVNSHSSELIGLLEETGLAEKLAREVAESEVNPEFSPDKIAHLTVAKSTMSPAREDPADLHRRVLNSWDQAKALLVRWMHHRYIFLQEITDREPIRPLNVYDHFADGGPPADWRVLLFCRLYRPYDNLPEPIADALEDAIADEQARPDEATWRRYLGWLVHETILDLLAAARRHASRLDEELVPRVRELVDDGPRTRRRRADPDAPAHGTLRHKIEGIIGLADDIGELQKRLDWIREGLEVLRTAFPDPDRSADDTLADEVAVATLPGEPIPSRRALFEHDNDFEEAVYQSLDDWMDWPEGEARRRFEEFMERAKAGEFRQ